MSSAVERAATSAPSGRDFDGERAALLAQAEALRAQSAALDCDAESLEVLKRVNMQADAALQQANKSAEATRARLSEQQERFKAGIISQGRSLEEELKEGESLAEAKSASAGSAPARNKYAVMMDKRKHLQDQQTNAQ